MRARIRSYLRLLLALTFAPVLAIFVIPVGNCFMALSGRSANCAAGLAGYAWYGLPSVVLAAALLGAPLLYVVLRAGLVKAWQFLMCGAGVGTCSALLLGLADHSLNILGMLAITIPVGAVTSGLVWLWGVHGNFSSDASLD